MQPLQLLLPKMIQVIWITSSLSDIYKESLRLSRVGLIRVPVSAVGFGHAFVPNENLPQKSLLLPSLVQAELS